MKSLKIIDEHIKHWNSMINQAYISNAENGYYDELDIVLFQERLKEYEQIKQDLEVLEIIRKLLIRTKYGVYESKNNGVVKYNRITMREIKEDEFDGEEFNKLKQWLEANENE